MNLTNSKLETNVHQPVVTVYTDGACKGNPGMGGWAVYSLDGTIDISGHNPYTTNNEMELTAILRALMEVQPSSKIVIKTDSKLSIGWLKMDWKSSKNPKNTRIIFEIKDIITRKNLKVSYEWIPGHGTDQINRYVDSVASKRCKG